MDQLGRNGKAKLVSTVPFVEILADMARPVSMDQLGRSFGGTAKPVSTVPFVEILAGMAKPVSMDQLGRSFGGTAKPVSTVPFAELLACMAKPVSMDYLGRNRQTFGGTAKLDSKVWWWWWWYSTLVPPVGQDAMFGFRCMAIHWAMECRAQVSHEIHWHKAIPDSMVSLAMHRSKGRTRRAEKGLQMPVDLHPVFERGKE
jgi:hypothetical protein